jgi:hypothetical protein
LREAWPANTDPPYGVCVEPRSNNAIAAGLSSFEGAKHHQSLDLARHPEKAKPTQKKLRAKDRPLANDFVSDAEFDRLLHAWFGNIGRVLPPGRAFFCWGGYSNIGNYPHALKASGLYFSQAIFQSPVRFGLEDAPSGGVVGDFNGDGKLDLAVTNFFSPNHDVVVFLGHPHNATGTQFRSKAGDCGSPSSMGGLGGAWRQEALRLVTGLVPAEGIALLHKY